MLCNQVATTEIGIQGTSSIALDDHRAFLYDDRHSMLVIPVSLYCDKTQVRRGGEGRGGEGFDQFRSQPASDGYNCWLTISTNLCDARRDEMLGHCGAVLPKDAPGDKVGISAFLSNISTDETASGACARITEGGELNRVDNASCSTCELDRCALCGDPT
jgi:hypothetical protein